MDANHAIGIEDQRRPKASADRGWRRFAPARCVRPACGSAAASQLQRILSSRLPTATVGLPGRRAAPPAVVPCGSFEATTARAGRRYSHGDNDPQQHLASRCSLALHRRIMTRIEGCEPESERVPGESFGEPPRGPRREQQSKPNLSTRCSAVTRASDQLAPASLTRNASRLFRKSNPIVADRENPPVSTEEI